MIQRFLPPVRSRFKAFWPSLIWLNDKFPTGISYQREGEKNGLVTVIHAPALDEIHCPRNADPFRVRLYCLPESETAWK
jgi:hypothetical protein